MNVIPLLYFIATIVAVVKSSAEANDGSALTKTKRLFESKHLLRGSGSNNENENEKKDEETSSINQISKRMLEAGTKRLLQLIEINLDTINFNFFCNDDEISNPPSMSPSSTPLYEEIFVASDGETSDIFGTSCSISDELVVIGAKGVDNEGAAYILNLDGTEVKKLTPGDDGEDYDVFGASVSIDEKVVVGSNGYVRVFSREGIYERTLLCDDCKNIGDDVATLENKIVTTGEQDSMCKLFIHSTEGQLLKTLEQERWIHDVAMSEKYIVSTAWGDGKTFIYNNTSPDFPKIAEINQGGFAVAVSGDRIVIGDPTANGNDGAVWLYNTNGTLVTTLDRQDSLSESKFGDSVAISDDRVVVSAVYDDDDQGIQSGSVFIYSADTGEFVEKVLAPDSQHYGHFGSCLSASDSHYIVGAMGVDWDTGAAYLFEFSED